MRAQWPEGVVWDALKAHLRGLIIHQTGKIKTTTKEWESLVLNEAKKSKGNLYS